MVKLITRTVKIETTAETIRKCKSYAALEGIKSVQRLLGELMEKWVDEYEQRKEGAKNHG